MSIKPPKDFIVEGTMKFVPFEDLPEEKQQRHLKCRDNSLEFNDTLSGVGSVSVELASTYFDGGTSELRLCDRAHAKLRSYTLNKQLTTPGKEKSPNWGIIVTAPYGLATAHECKEVSLEELKEVLDVLQCHVFEAQGVLNNFVDEYKRRGGEWD